MLVPIERRMLEGLVNQVRMFGLSFLLLVPICMLCLGVQVADAETPYADTFPEVDSKKGLLVEMIDDALSLGVKHATLNVQLQRLVSRHVESEENCFHWRHRGQLYYFDETAIVRLDRQVKTLSDHGALVYLILLVGPTGSPATDKVMLHPNFDQTSPNKLSAFNSVTREGREQLTATIQFLAERWSRPDHRYGRVVGYIVGNEVNSHWWWCNRGRVDMRSFADDYLQAVRVIHSAVRSQASWPRVYISLEHHWHMRYPAGDEMQAFSGKEFIDYFAARARQSKEGDFDWHLAFHSYPEDLFEPRFWNDETALVDENTPRITFKNLEVLTQYFQQEKLLYDGRPRSIILSEQGFHTPDGPLGEQIQAAAFCYAYRKIENLNGIDAFILHRHVDHPNEGGLRLGLRRHQPESDVPRPAKLIYHCFRMADTDQWETAFSFALPIVGLTQWQ